MQVRSFIELFSFTSLPCMIRNNAEVEMVEVEMAEVEMVEVEEVKMEVEEVEVEEVENFQRKSLANHIYKDD